MFCLPGAFCHALIAQRSFADRALGLVLHSCADGRIGSGATSR